MSIDILLNRFSQGLEPVPGGDASRSMVLHGRHLDPQIMAGIDGDNWRLQDYVARGMTAYVEKVQEPEFAARDRGYTFVSHQQEVGTGYFDDVTTVIQGGASSVTALTGSTEEEQFH